MKLDDALMIHTFYGKVLGQEIDIDLAWDMQSDFDLLQPHIKRFNDAKEKSLKKYGTADGPVDPSTGSQRYVLNDVAAYSNAVEELLKKDIKVKIKKYPEATFRAGLRGVRVDSTLRAAKDLIVISPNGKDSKK